MPADPCPLIQLAAGDIPHGAARTAALLRQRLSAAPLQVRPGGVAGTVRLLGMLSTSHLRGVCVHAVGPAALAAAAMWRGAARIAYTPTAFPDRAAVGWVRATAAISRAAITVVVDTETARRKWVEFGYPDAQCVLIRPGVPMGGVRDPALRAALAGDDRLLLAGGEPSRDAGADVACWAAGILRELDGRHRVTFWPGQTAAARAVASTTARVTARSGRGVLAIAPRDATHRALAAAADVAVFAGRGPVDAWAVADAMAAGTPIVSAVTYTLGELLEDRHTALMVARPTPRSLARRLLDLAADPALAATLADHARAEAYTHYAVSRFVSEWSAVLNPQDAETAAASAGTAAASAGGAGFAIR